MYNVSLVLVGICIFAIPILLITLIVQSVRKKANRGIGYALMSCMVCFVVFTIVGVFNVPPEKAVDNVHTSTVDTASKTQSEKATSSPKGDKKDDSYFKADDTQKGKVADVDTTLVTTLIKAGYSLEHATKIAEILSGVGIESIKIDAMTGDPEKGLNAVMCYPNGLKERDKRFRFTTEDGVVFNAGFFRYMNISIFF